MTKEEQAGFFDRIDALTSSHEAIFGKMSVHQMVPHCTDQIRAALGIIHPKVEWAFDPKQIIEMARAGISVRTPKGLDQVAGEGTPPTDLENDKKLLKEFILKFCETDDDHPFSDHPYFGKRDKRGWNGLIKYHLNHHLGQFGV